MPDFLSGQDAAAIQAEMLAAIPDGYDKSEGGFIWDMTYPTAIEKAEIAQYLLPEALKCMFPMWASGEMLDMHGANRGLTRKGAVAATCTLKFTGTDGAKIPMGSVASTLAAAGEDVIAFSTLADCTISGGAASVEARATAPGAQGNVAAGSVSSIDEYILGVSAVTNEAAAAGGLDTESDAAFRSRITQFDAAQGSNHVGSTADYRRWALEVNGVGNAKVVPAGDDSGLVTLIITDSSGQSATAALCQTVSDHIMRPDDPPNRLAPINAALTVATPQPLNILLAASVTLEGASAADVKARYALAANEYFGGITDGVVRVAKLCALLSGIDGVKDFSNFTLNGASANLTFNDMQLPQTSESMVTLT